MNLSVTEIRDLSFEGLRTDNVDISGILARKSTFQAYYNDLVDLHQPAAIKVIYVPYCNIW